MTALITGGTAGIGATFARHLAARGENLVLVARDADRLTAFAAELNRTYGVEVETLPADLGKRDDLAKVAERLGSTEAPIDALVNNAGFGLHSNMLVDDISTDELAIDVMCKAVLVLANAAARAMKPRGRGRIINTSSTAGYITMGHYSAIKAYVTTYSEALATQLEGSGVTVTALCPGWVHTEFHDRAGIDPTKIPSAAWIDADTLVREAIADAASGRVLSIPTPQWKVAILLARLAPRPAIRWVSRKLGSARH